MRPSLIFLIPYFGRLPEWIELFIESCKWNPDIRWRLFTDCPRPENRADNVEFVATSFADYKALARERIGLEFDPRDPYKLCDLRPALGEIHEREIAEFDFFGYGDLDVVYGDLRRFYSDELLARHDVLSTHADRLSGHFALFRNTPALRRAYRRYPRFREILAAPDYVGMDESLGTLFRPPARRGRGLGRRLRALLARFDRQRRRSHFVERHSTVLSPRGWHDGSMRYPARWFWRGGHLTNDRDGGREFMYLHFMRWQSRRWMAQPPGEGEGAWLELDRVVRFDWREAARSGFCVSREGFTRCADGAEASCPPTPPTA
jgi:hypothetical protein